MEEKLLELFKLANELDKKQDKLYAKVEYNADKTRKLEIIIVNKENYTYIEKCSVMLVNNPVTKLDIIIEILKAYIPGGVINE